MACAKHSLKKPAAGEQLGQSGSQNVLRTLKSMAKVASSHWRSIKRLVARGRASATSRIRRSLTQSRRFLSAEETAYLESRVRVWLVLSLGHRQDQRLRMEWLKTLTADCAVQESDDPHLRNEGHVQYFYVKEMKGETHRRARAEDEVVQESGGAEHQRIRRGRSCKAIQLAPLSVPPLQPLDLASAHGWCVTASVSRTT